MHYSTKTLHNAVKLGSEDITVNQYKCSNRHDTLLWKRTLFVSFSWLEVIRYSAKTLHHVE
jgi:hypothetical protein